MSMTRKPLVKWAFRAVPVCPRENGLFLVGGQRPAPTGEI